MSRPGVIRFGYPKSRKVHWWTDHDRIHWLVTDRRALAETLAMVTKRITRDKPRGWFDAVALTDEIEAELVAAGFKDSQDDS